jgi:hypothetical protein
MSPAQCAGGTALRTSCQACQENPYTVAVFPAPVRANRHVAALMLPAGSKQHARTPRMDDNDPLRSYVIYLT